MPSDEDYYRRTAITRLDVDEDDEALLRETVDHWRDGCQIAVVEAWNRCHSKSDVQELAYDSVRNHTALGSQHAILATHQAAENIKSCISRKQNGKKASKPEYTSPCVTYDSRTMTLFPEKEQVSLTVAGDHTRVRPDLILPDDEDGYQHQYLDSDEWKETESTLHYRDGDWYLHLGFRKPKPDDEETTENGTVLGVDLGVKNIAVTSTARFFSAGELNHKRREFERIRGNLQDTGTQNAHRTLQQVSGREDEYVKHVLHSVANGIVEEAVEHECDGIIFEELDEIREQLPNADWHSEWAFNRLFEFVKYKAESEGIFVDTVNPKNTSKRCVECGHISDDNRDAVAFECEQCGNQNHADYNAAKNVAELYLLRGHQSPRGRSVSQYALKSGPKTPSRGHTSLPMQG